VLQGHVGGAVRRLPAARRERGDEGTAELMPGAALDCFSSSFAIAAHRDELSR
jgi:hypothetical protein